MRKINQHSVELSLFILQFLNKAPNHNVLILLLFFISGFQSLDITAQITSPSAEALVSTQYPVDTVQSPVFIFYNPPGIDIQGELIASMPANGNLNFDWYKYNTISGNFDQLLLSHTGVSESLLSNLTAGGYRVHIWNGADTDTTLTAWVHIDKLFTFIEKDAQGRLKKSAFTCDYLTLSATVTIDTFFYYDPINGQKVRLANGFSFLWTSDNSELRIPNKDKILDPNTTYQPPYLDTWYILTATDSFGMVDIDSVFYESIQVGPYPPETMFSIKVYDKEETKDFADETIPFEGDSPMRVKFLNESVNGFKYEWIFSDSAKSDYFDNEFTDAHEYQPEYLYKIPNDYYPAIVVISEAGCIDTFKVEEPITVLPSLLEIPNVFSPDGNGQNDYFKVKFQSMKEFSIRIFDRGGKLVYKAEISDMYTWEGWDGNVLDSKRPASPGIYYYVIDATGWDQEHYHKGQYRGVVYLFREAN